MKLQCLQEIDNNLLGMSCGNGMIWISNLLGGRIFCSIGDELIHQFRADLAKNPEPGEFNNLGGNSLWPAPEGGKFAYNYLPDGTWTVQDAVSVQPSETVSQSADFPEISKAMKLKSRQGKEIKMNFERRVKPLDLEKTCSEYNLRGVGYHSDESLTPQGEYPIDDFLVAAWSLEQFPGADGVVAFGKTASQAEGCINDDFYGNPHPRLSYHDHVFQFKLGGPDRLQIGIKAEFAPELIGTLDEQRGLLIIRTTPVRSDGRYINIADNDQPNGVYSAADCFSIFNGASELNFYELETIAPMQEENGILGASRLESETMIFQGAVADLKRCLEQCFKIKLQN